MPPETLIEPLPTVMPKLSRVQLGGFTREARAEGDAADEKPRRYRVVITSESPRQTWAGIETLSHEASAIDLSLAKRGVSVYLEHGGPDLGHPRPELHVGIVEDIELNTEKRQLEGWMRFSRHALAQQTEQDVQDGTRVWVSGSYILVKAKETKPAEKYGDVREYTVTRWRLCECGIVGIPADPRAVIKRSAGGEEFPVEIESETPAEERAMPPVTDAPQPTPAAGGAPQPAAAEPAGAGDRATRAGGGSPGNVQVLDRNAEVAEIFEMCSSNGLAERAPGFVREGRSADWVAREILKLRATPAAAQPPAEGLGVPKKDAKRYSYARAIRMAAEVREGTRSKFDGVEGELHQELDSHLPPTMQRRGGILLPLRLERADEDRPREVRAMGSGVAGGGAETVFDQPGEFIDLLRNRTLLAAFGAQMLTGLTSPVTFPKQTGDPTVQWMQENPPAGAATGELTFGSVTASPKTMIGTVPFPRQLLNLSQLDIESRVRITLALRHGLAIDLAGIHGPGVSNQPLGIYNTPGVNTVAFGSAVPTFGKLVDMQGQIGDKNADAETMAYLTTPLMAAKLKQVLVASAAGSGFIWEGKLRDGLVAGYRAGSTGQVSKTMSGLASTGGSEHGILFGDWSQVVMAFWGAMEVVTDVVTLADRGQIKITTFQMGDIVCLRPEAFCVSTAATIA